MASIPHFDISRQHEHLKAALDDAFERVIRRSWFILGEEVKAFEREFGEYLGAAHCVGCANGTDALELALKASGIGPGEEVIIPANTWVSLAEAVVNIGAAPVFADSLPGEYTIDPASVERCLTMKTRAIIVVHQFGQPARMDALLQIRNQHQLTLIEDCAHAHGAAYKGRKVGTMGDFGCFSFYPTKNLGCLGDGGAVVTNNEASAKFLRLLSNHGQLVRNRHEMVGRNSRLHELQAAFLRAKLPQLEQWNIKRRSIASAYSQGLDKSMYQLPSAGDPNFSIFHQYVIQTEDREQLVDHMEKHGINVAIHYPELIGNMPPYKICESDPDGLITGEAEKSRILSLPMFPELTNEEVLKVVHVLNNFRG